MKRRKYRNPKAGDTVYVVLTGKEKMKMGLEHTETEATPAVRPVVQAGSRTRAEVLSRTGNKYTLKLLDLPKDQDSEITVKVGKWQIEEMTNVPRYMKR